MLAASRRSSSISSTLMPSSIRTAPKRYLKGSCSPHRLGGRGGGGILAWVYMRRPNFRVRSGGTGQEPQEVSILKTPKTIGLLAVPVVLAAAVISATGVFAKAPAHQSAATAPTTAPTTASTPAPDVAPTTAPSQSAVAPSQ